MGSIYKIENIINHKVYIGQTRRTVETRWKEHIKYSKDSKCLIHQAMRQYGIENFNFSVIEQCPEEQLDDREIYWIQYYNSYEDGYNMTLGGQGIVSTNFCDTIIKQYSIDKSISKTARTLNLGISTVREVLRREEIEYNRDCSLPKQIEMIDPKTLNVVRIFESIHAASAYKDNWQRETIRDAVSGRRQSAYGFFWKEHKQEKNFSNQKIYKHMQKVGKFDKKTLQLIDVYPSIRAANIAMNKPKDHKSISNAVNGRAKTALGYVWKYLD